MGSQDGPRWSQDGPRWSQDGPRWSQDEPRWRQDGGKMEPGIKKEPKEARIKKKDESRTKKIYIP